MNKKHLFITAGVLIVAITMAFVIAGDTSKEQSPVTGETVAPVSFVSSEESEDFKWFTVTEAIELQKTSGKKMFIDVYTTWCGPCKMLDANTFSNATIKSLLKQYYIPAKFNAESADTILFNGQTFVNKNYSPQPRKSTHEFAIYIASTDQGLGYPTMVFLDENQQMIQPIPSYVTPEQLEPILKFFGTDAYKTTDWQTYLSTFKSSISQ